MVAINKLKSNDLKQKVQIYRGNTFLFISEFDDENIFNFIINEFGNDYLLKNFGGNVNGIDSYGRAPTHYLVKTFKLMKFWISKYKPNINIKTTEGINAAFCAAEIGNTPTLQTLIENQCDISLKNRFGQNIIRKAIDFHFPSIGKNILSTIKLLLDINVNPFEKDMYNQSAYDIAVEDNKLDVIDLINKYKQNFKNMMLNDN